VTKANFSGTSESAYRKDYAGGIANGAYYLKTCGFFSQFTQLNQTFQRTPLNIYPNIDLNALP
jgi:hypothetical protein